MKNHARVSFLVIAATIASCGGSPDGHEDAVGATEQRLLQSPRTNVLWPGRPAVIRVSVDSFTASSADGSTADVADVLMQTLRDSWSAVANVDFVRAASGEDFSVRVLFTRVPTWGAIGGNADVGSTSTASQFVQMSFCDLNYPLGLHCPGPMIDEFSHVTQGSCTVVDAVDCTYGWEIFRATVIHEFGHVLGFLHEQQRSDTPGTVGPGTLKLFWDGTHFRYRFVPGWCADASTQSRRDNPGNSGFVDGPYLTPSYDKDSIMNYCRDQNSDNQPDGYRPWDTVNDHLSAGDEAGAQAAYGARTRPACGHDVCTAGNALPSACTYCASDVCNFDPYCCTVAWDSICVGEVPTDCGRTCP